MQGKITVSLLLILVTAVLSMPLYAAGEKIVIATFTTSVSDQDENVKKNIAIAAERLNGTILPAGKVFSFNDTVGEGSAGNGFLSGRVLYQDRTAYESGGGLCQVSSTLYNALLLAGCNITERYRHFQPVSYVPLGLDATIKYGKKNLRMKNPYDWNLYISTSMNEKSFTVIIRSDNTIPYSYELFTEEDEITLPFQENSERKVRPGISINVYRKKFRDGKLTGSYLLYRDFYPPVYYK